MKLETFFEKLELFADAPGAVQKMRELVLELALQGRLVEQRSKEASADELLEEIEASRNSIRKEGRGRRLESIPPLGSDDAPFHIPSKWRWCRLGMLGLISSSCRVHEKDWTTSGVPFYRAREIVRLAKSGKADNDLFITEQHYQRLASEGLIPKPNDIMITGVGTIGVPYIVGEADRFYFKDASVLIFKNVFGLYPHYLRLVMLSSYWDREIHRGSMGTTVHTFTIIRAKQTPIPLPPLAEQRRIVSKVDELMALCDRLEAQQQERRTLHTALARASLARFADAPTPANLDFLFHKSYAISPAELRKAILTLAVQGNLLDGAETGAWPTVALEDVCLQITDGEHATPQRTATGVPLATAKNVRDGFLDLRNADYVAPSTAEKCWRRCKPRDQDLLMVCVGATTGRVCLAKNPPDIVLVRSVALIRPNAERIAPTFLNLFLRSPAGQSQIWGSVKQSA